MSSELRFSDYKEEFTEIIDRAVRKVLEGKDYNGNQTKNSSISNTNRNTKSTQQNKNNGRQNPNNKRV